MLWTPRGLAYKPQSTYFGGTESFGYMDSFSYLNAPGYFFEAAARITAGVIGQFLWALDSDRSANVGTLEEGSLNLKGGPNINVVRRPSVGGIRFHRTVGRAFSEWRASHDQDAIDGLRCFLQFDPAEMAIVCPYNRSGGGFLDFDIPLANRAEWGDIATGSEFIVAIGYPS